MLLSEDLYMTKIAIVSDSSISISKDDPLISRVHLIPLSIIHNNTQYLDQVNLTSEDVNKLLRDKQLLQTSQPSIGNAVEVFENLKNENFDRIYVVCLSSALSGTINSINQAVSHVGLDNVTIIDTMSVAGPCYYIVETILKLHEAGKSHDEIMQAVDYCLNDTYSFVFPETLEQLKRSGRISSGAATLASLLKIKPILFLETKGKTIEKFGTARTDSKVYEKLIEAMIQHNVKPETHVLYYLENLALDKVNILNSAITQAVGSFETKVLTLPAVLATHVGLGAVVLQWIRKPNI